MAMRWDLMVFSPEKNLFKSKNVQNANSWFDKRTYLWYNHKCRLLHPLTLITNADFIIENGFLNLGMVWYSVVHHGTNSRKDEDIRGV